MSDDRLEKLFSEHIVVMQAAWIEWQHGRGAEAAMQWIENTLDGPGLLPLLTEPCGTNAQKYFDLNRPDALPLCAVCGEPSHVQSSRGAFCSMEHASQADQEGDSDE